MKKGIILLLFCCLTAAAQRPVETSLRFDSTTWDFGLIKEADGVVSHEFNYINLSDHDVVLEFVTPGCSCTTTTYNHSPLPPGQAATIVVHFDPASQPGQFHQTVQIVLKGGKERYNLIVEGVVAERERDVDQAYPFPLVPGLQVSSLTARFGFVQQGRSLVKAVGIANTSDREMRLEYALDHPDKDIVVRLPQVLQVGQTALVEIDFSPEPGRLGTLDNGIAIFPAGESKGKSVALEGYAVQTVDKKPGAASLRFQPTQLDFGKVKIGRKAKASVTLFNDGNEALKILKMEIPEAITLDFKQNASIAPGKSMKLEAVLLLKDKYFRQDELRVRLFTNDPNRPIRDIVCRLSLN